MSPNSFEIDWIDDDTLEVTYKSHRSLLGVYMGLARGVGKRFGEPMKVGAVGRDRVRIQFE